MPWWPYEKAATTESNGTGTEVELTAAPCADEELADLLATVEKGQGASPSCSVSRVCVTLILMVASFTAGALLIAFCRDRLLTKPPLARNGTTAPSFEWAGGEDEVSLEQNHTLEFVARIQVITPEEWCVADTHMYTPTPAPTIGDESITRTACGACSKWESDAISDVFGTSECTQECTQTAVVLVAGWVPGVHQGLEEIKNSNASVHVLLHISYARPKRLTQEMLM